MGLKEQMERNQRNRESGFDPLAAIGVINTSGESVTLIAPDKLHAFEGHTFIIDVTQPAYESLREAIKEHGIQQPLVVRPHMQIVGDYEIISGHRRYQVAQELCLAQLPCIVKPMDDDTAIQVMGVSNIQRPDWLPSEKAKTYKAHLEATKRKTGITAGRPITNNSGTEFPNFRNREEAAKIWGISGRALDMYIKLNELTAGLLEMVDSGQINIKAGYQLAFLLPENQATLEAVLRNHPKKKITLSISRDIKVAEGLRDFTEENLLSILGLGGQVEKKEKEIKFNIMSQELRNSNTIRAALTNADVMEKIEQVLLDYARENNLPLE